MRKKVLFIGGSLNQTTIMFQIAQQLPEVDTWFTPYYADGWLQKAAEKGLLNKTILGGTAKRATLDFLRQQGVQIDEGGQLHPYDLVLTGSDNVIPENIRDKKIVLIQEGMMVPETWRYHLIRKLKLPRYLGNTAMTGLSHAYTKFCVASEGWKQIFIRKGIPAHKIEVTGIPNFDHMSRFLENNFPHQDYVLAATSCLRETLQYENRKAFIQQALKIADGRPLFFKLHPNENHSRAISEITRYAPGNLVFTQGSINPMIANCSALVTKYSSVILTALGLDKPVYSDLTSAELQAMRPLQNGGTSAQSIAKVVRQQLGHWVRIPEHSIAS